MIFVTITGRDGEGVNKFTESLHVVFRGALSLRRQGGIALKLHFVLLETTPSMAENTASAVVVDGLHRTGGTGGGG